MGFLLAGDHLTLETPSPLPHGEEDLGEAFDFDDSEEEEEEEEDSAAEPSGEAVLQAPPRRRRAASSGVGEEHGGFPVSSMSPPCPLWVPRVALLQAWVPTPFLFAFPLCRRAGAGDPGRVCGVLGGLGCVCVCESLEGESTTLGFVLPV